MAKRIAKLDKPFVNRIIGHGEERVDQMLANPLNFRLHPDNQQQALAGSIDDIGFIRSVTVNKRTGRVVDGHLRVTIAARSNVESLPVEYVDLTEAEEAQALLSLDPIAGMAASDKAKLDELMRAVQSDDERVQQMMADMAEREGLEYGRDPQGEDPGAQVDKAEELREKWGVETGQLWKLGEHRLICGDCTDRAVVERVMGGEKAQGVFIDPPYMTFGSSTGKLESGDFAMLAPFWDIVVKTAQENLDDGRAAFICCDWRSYPTLFNAAFKHMAIKNLIVWDMGGALKMGTGNFRPSYELLIYAVNTKFGRNWQEKQTGSWKIEDRSARDLWTIKQNEAAPGKNRDHASQKPTELIDRALGYSTNEGDTVFDYFSGSGTVMISCERLSRKCRAIEISPAYVAVALQRWADMTGKTPELVTT